MIILKTRFFLLQYQSGTNLASTLETQQASILFNTFKIKLLNFIQPCANSILNIIISLSCHEQVCLSGLRFERYFSHHRAR